MNASRKISSVSRASQVHDGCCVPLKSFLISNRAADSDKPLLSILAQHMQKGSKDGERTGGGSPNTFSLGGNYLMAAILAGLGSIFRANV